MWAGRRCRRLLPNLVAQGLAHHLKKCAVRLAAQRACGNRESILSPCDDQAGFAPGQTRRSWHIRVMSVTWPVKDRYGSRLCENSNFQLACRISVSISSMRKPIALATTVGRRQLRKQFCASLARSRFHTASVKTGNASVGGAGPLYPRQQTSSGRPGMSVKCHKATHAPHKYRQSFANPWHSRAPHLAIRRKQQCW
jgi:hypothetical protein